MSDRDTPPPDPDAMTWWEHRELAKTQAGTAENLARKAKPEPGNAANLLAQA